MKFIKNNKTYLMLSLIITVGVFLRVYNFHAWMDFSNDQVRDAVLVSQVVKGEVSLPLLGPTMRKSGSSKDDLFHLGPAYYYFQIVSAKIFGNQPDKLAYPDLLFSILSIPLFFIFLKKYFSVNCSLAIVGLYAISFYAILYSRFAWNPNPIPFFTILFLLSLHEFLINREKTNWIWPILIGVAVGIGMQLHMILFLLFPATLFFVFLFLIRNNRKLWSRFLLVFLVIIILNIPQIISETRNNYANSRAFLASVENGSQNKKSNIFQKIIGNADCQVETNSYILAPLGQNECSFSYLGLFENGKNSVFLKKMHDPVFWLSLISSLLFSVLGYILLFSYFHREKEERKKYFLGLIMFYSALSFCIMMPVVASGLLEFRYFIHVFFVPFIFLGLFIVFLSKKYPKNYPIIVSLFLIFIIAVNFFAIISLEKELAAGNRTDDHSVVLGEIEPMVQYLIASSEKQKEIYLVGDSPYVTNLGKAFAYLAEKENVNIINAVGNKKISQGKPVFYIWKSSKNGTADEFGGRRIESYKIFGQIVIYKLQN